MQVYRRPFVSEHCQKERRICSKSAAT